MKSFLYTPVNHGFITFVGLLLMMGQAWAGSTESEWDNYQKLENAGNCGATGLCSSVNVYDQMGHIIAHDIESNGPLKYLKTRHGGHRDFYAFYRTYDHDIDSSGKINLKKQKYVFNSEKNLYKPISTLVEIPSTTEGCGNDVGEPCYKEVSTSEPPMIANRKPPVSILATLWGIFSFTILCIIGFLGVVTGFALLFLPTIVAKYNQDCRNWGVILLINLCLGWTGIGWLVALIMALWKPPQPYVFLPPRTKEDPL